MCDHSSGKEEEENDETHVGFLSFLPWDNIVRKRNQQPHEVTENREGRRSQVTDQA